MSHEKVLNILNHGEMEIKTTPMRLAETLDVVRR